LANYFEDAVRMSGFEAAPALNPVEMTRRTREPLVVKVTPPYLHLLEHGPYKDYYVRDISLDYNTGEVEIELANQHKVVTIRSPCAYVATEPKDSGITESTYTMYEYEVIDEIDSSQPQWGSIGYKPSYNP
jgi:hypothetical protein